MPSAVPASSWRPTLHAELRKIWMIESGGLTGNGTSFNEFLLERILLELMTIRDGNMVEVDYQQEVANGWAKAARARAEIAARAMESL
jgi:hypothetical protein